VRGLTQGGPARLEHRGFLLANLTLGHAVAHFYQRGFLVLLPKIVSDLDLSGVGVGSLDTVRHLTSFSIEVPGGFVVDMLRRRWREVFVGCMGLIAVAWAVTGAVPSLPFLLVAMVLISLPGTIWHLPAMAALSRRFPERRGMAISVHGLGGNLGNVVGPLVAGVLLGFLLLTWRQVAFLYALPPLFLALLFWVSLRSLRGDSAEEGKRLGDRLQDAFGLLKSSAVLRLVSVAMLRAVGFNAISWWTPIYLSDELELGDATVGFYVALLTALGMVALPFMGTLSDRFGRKPVLVPGLIAMSVLSFLLVNVGAGLGLTIVIAAMGLFSYSLNQVIRAAVLDLAPSGAEATSYGLVFGLTQPIIAVSSILAGAMKDWLGVEFVFYYATVVVALSALILVISPMPKPGAPAPTLNNAPRE
jgi:MFS family permease